MEPPDNLIRRKRWLTNEPAEFVENGAAFRTLLELAESPEELEDLKNLEITSEYSPVLDKFVPKDTVLNDSRYYQDSRNRKLEFQQSLERFACILKSRNVDKELRIEIKDPKDFDLRYILEIIDKIEKHTTMKRPYKAFFKRYLHKVEENKAVIEGILSFVPDDIYGSLISGGFTLILAGLEKHTEEREATENFLAEIQDRLSGIQRLHDIHRGSPGVHSCADAILVSVFAVLERIMEKITKDWESSFLDPLKAASSNVKKFIGKGRKTKLLDGTIVTSVKPQAETGNAQSIPEALAELQRCVDRFQNEVDLATKEMIGSIDKNIKSFPRAVVWLARNMGASMKKNNEDLLIIIQDTLFRVLRSDSFINNKTAQVDLKEMEQNALEQTARSKRRVQKESGRAISTWMSELHGFDYDSMTDIKDCIEHVEQLDGNDKNVSERILDSEQLNDWLQDEQSSFLMIDLQTPQSELNNPLSFTSALLAMSLRSTEKYPVLSFFCMHRNMESPDEAVSGPLGMIKSLNGQLLDFMNQKRLDSDVARLKKEDFFSKSKKNLKHGVSLLQALLSLLPDGDVVFIILDCLSCLSGDEKKCRKLVKAMNKILESQESISIRVLVTDPSADSPLRRIAHWQLHLPDVVAGGDTVDLDETTQRISKGLADSHHTSDEDGEDDEEGSEETEDESGDDSDFSSNEDDDETDSDDDD
ncbi:hypothetical protein EV127DRAFT_509713 [Xylaria flabelliformis]|nr:hypothetical protein EV127DRAFT_509713 [Xylaria flabelliformis]